MDALAKKNALDGESVRLWMEELREKRLYSVKYNVSSHVNGPFLVSWMSPWQKMVYIIC